MSKSNPHADALTHRLFLITILTKGVLGLIQLATAAAIFLGMTEKLPAFAEWMFRAELNEDPKDFLATHIISWSGIIPQSDLTFYKIYFSAHGALHVGVVAALLYGAQWANHAAIAVLGAFVVYQVMEWFSVGGVMLIVLTVIDLAVIYLTVIEHRRNNSSFK